MKITLGLFMATLMLVTGCGDLVTVDRPKTEITDVMVFENDATALSAVRGLYSEMAKAPYFNNTGIAITTGLTGDELISASELYKPFECNTLREDNPIVLEYLYAPAYRVIYLANSILEGIESSTGLTVPIRAQARGEALFVRGLSYFYLTQLFGAVPHALTTDIEINSGLKRTHPDVVLDGVADDLVEAKSLLTEEYKFTAAGERIQATHWAACALLARLYLYRGEWSAAEQEADIVISRTDLFGLAALAEVFKSNSKEAILQLYPVIPNSGAMDATVFYRRGGIPQFSIGRSLIKSFDDNDQRRELWVDSVIFESKVYHISAKYRSLVEKEEYHVELRLAELILIRAESRAMLGRWDDAFDDLDLIRDRAGLPPIERSEVATLDKLMLLILHERQVELFTENGHRWFDLQRTQNADNVLTVSKGNDWQTTDALFPIPGIEIANNTNLEPQNEGY